MVTNIFRVLRQQQEIDDLLAKQASDNSRFSFIATVLFNATKLHLINDWYRSLSYILYQSWQIFSQAISLAGLYFGATHPRYRIVIVDKLPYQLVHN
jgi:hypothetical protein